MKKSIFILVALLSWAASLSTVFVLPVQAQSFIATQKVPPIIRRHFTLAPPPKSTGDRWSMDDSRETFWSFTIKPTLDCEVVSLGQLGNVWIAQVMVKRATIRVGLLMDVYLGEHPSSSDIEHQEGYVLICERFYKDAEAIVKEVTQRIFPEKISGRGPDAEAAVKDAMAKATDGLAFGYFMNSGRKAQRISRAFDLVATQKNKSLVEQVILAFKVAELHEGMFNSSSKKQTRPEVHGVVRPIE